MNYYALFLNGDSYIEKCLSLIKYIGNPDSNSLPHVTLRLFKNVTTRISDTKNKEISHINIIEPGTFNINENRPPFVVYIRCESEELEGNEYKPDYPYSRLHITLYEGDDISYAKNLFSLLNKEDWHFKLAFETPKRLTEQIIGTKISNKDYFQDLYKEILGGDNDNQLLNCTSNNDKLNITEKVIASIHKYIEEQPVEIKNVQSFYVGKELTINSNQYVDESKNGIRYKSNQLSFDSIDSDKIPLVDKPIQDAIYVTPPEYARDMAECALEAFGDDSRKIDFGDSAIGTGALFIALKNLIDEKNKIDHTKYSINSAVGIDIDEEMAKESFVRYSQRGLAVIFGDAILSDTDLGEQRNFMLVNPPYNRINDIPKEYRLHAKRLAQEQTGIDVVGGAGLYVYHILIMDKWLKNNGVGVWLLPTIFLQSRYGESIRQYLLNNVNLVKLHVYSEKTPQFEGRLISTTIVVFEKREQDNESKVIVSYGDSVAHPMTCSVVSKKTLYESLGNWRQVIHRLGDEQVFPPPNPDSLKFEDVFEIKRGLATGANSFFVLERSEARKIGIPEFALKPLLPKARFLSSWIIDSKEDGYPDVAPQLVLIDCDKDESIIEKNYSSFHKYLQMAKIKGADGKTIVERTLIKSRKPWYKQETREAPPYLLTYMGRNKENLPPLYFVLNKSNAVALNTYLLLYPRDWLMDLINKDHSLYEKLLFALNNSAAKLIAQQTRIYSGGLHKLEPGELKRLPITGFPVEMINMFISHRQQYNR